jgi:hypothetical protein
MAITISKPFAIYQTRQGIELRRNPAESSNVRLICVISHYESAVRIAREVAQIRQQPLFISGIGYVDLT